MHVGAGPSWADLRPGAEQVGTPDELYDRPANDFVMRFLGPVTNLGGRIFRPHDIDVLPDAGPTTVSARVERLVRLGFEVRVDAVDDQGQTLSVQLTRVQVESLTMAPGKVINLRPSAPPLPETAVVQPASA